MAQSMAAERDLVGLPIEILNMIVEKLTLADNRSLRLVSRMLAAKITGTSFKSYFENKTITFTLPSLEMFAAVTEQPYIRSALQNLKIVGLTSQTLQPTNFAPLQRLSLLTVALHNICQDLNDQDTVHLHSLSMDLVNDGEPYGPSKAARRGPIPGWQGVWELAANMGVLIGRAIGSSQIRVAQLDVYANSQRCALGAEHLTSVMGFLNSQALKTLSIGVSADSSKGLDGYSEEDLSTALKYTLRPLVNLEELDIRYLSITSGRRAAAGDTGRHLLADLAASRDWLPHLKTLSLRGLYTSQDALSAFIAAHSQLTTLTLDNIHLEDGKWTTIFAQIEQHNMLSSLHLNDLYEDENLIQFSTKGKSHFEHSGGPTWLSRMPDKQSKPIRYKRMRSRWPDSAAFLRWYRRSTLMYGPIQNT